MKANEILELVRAGFTKAEIAAMEAGPVDTPVPEEQPAEPAPAAAPAAEQPEPAEKTPEPEAKPAWAVSLEKSVAAMIQTMQSMNRASSGRGSVETVQTTDDILREMFAEPKKGA